MDPQSWIVVTTLLHVNLCFHPLDGAAMPREVIDDGGAWSGKKKKKLKSCGSGNLLCFPVSLGTIAYSRGKFFRERLQLAALLLPGFSQALQLLEEGCTSHRSGEGTGLGTCWEMQGWHYFHISGTSCSLLDCFGQCFHRKAKRCYASLQTWALKGNSVCVFLFISFKFVCRMPGSIRVFCWQVAGLLMTLAGCTALRFNVPEASEVSAVSFWRDFFSSAFINVRHRP